MYIYEAKLSRDEDGLYLSFSDFPGAVADGNTLKEVMEAAVETIRLVIAEYVDAGDQLPVPKYAFPDEAGRVAIAVEVDEEFIERTKCVTPTEAAEMLGLSKGRISHMLKSGVLQAVRFGDERLVTIASINKRKKASVGAGRPKTEHTTSFTSAIKVVYSGQLHTNQDELKSLDNSGAGVTVYRTKEPLELSPLESDVLNYEGVCRLGDSEKKCMVAKAPKGMVDIIVAGDGSGLFDGANEFDSITVYPRRAVMIDDIELEYFKS